MKSGCYTGWCRLFEHIFVVAQHSYAVNNRLQELVHSLAKQHYITKQENCHFQFLERHLPAELEIFSTIQ